MDISDSWIKRVGFHKSFPVSDINPPIVDVDEIAKEEMARELARFLLEQGVITKRIIRKGNESEYYPYQKWEYEVSNLWVIIPPKEERERAAAIVGWLDYELQKKLILDKLREETE